MDVERVIDEEIARLQRDSVTEEELERARTKMRSWLYAQVDSGARFGLVDLLSLYALFDDNPAGVNDIEAGLASVTPDLVQRTALEYLRKTNRTIVLAKPGTGEEE